MCKQSKIDSLVVLLQAALSENPQRELSNLNLQEVYKTSQQQEVIAIALDGLQKLSVPVGGINLS